MYNVKIIGAGSIGNHLAHACRSLGWEVLLCDTDPAALERTRTSIYPSRYGSWDQAIELASPQQCRERHFDAVFVGTPPDTHIALAREAIGLHHPKVLMIEKPVCGLSLQGCEELIEEAEAAGTFVGVGYNHALTPQTLDAQKILGTGLIGEPVTLTVRWTEHWGGIFSAHPWLAGPSDSYLGYASRGGGACGEHSHGVNIWQHFAHVLGLGRVSKVQATMDMIQENGAHYDRICQLHLTTETGLVGYVIQDVVTHPPVKTLRVQGAGGFLEWSVNDDSKHDAVIYGSDGGPPTKKLFPKTRPDDFKAEVEHVEALMNHPAPDSPVSFARGLDTMRVVVAAHRSNTMKQAVPIDYTQATAGLANRPTVPSRNELPPLMTRGQS